jgi:hypothetical protein
VLQVTHKLAVIFTLGPCTALSPHHHNSTELLVGTAGNTSVAFVDEADAVHQGSVAPGQLFELPMGARQ